MPSATSPMRRWLLTITCLLSVLLAASVASAAGRVDWKSKKIKESSDGGSWRLEVTIYLPRAPDTPHVPAKFEFSPVSYFERAMVDGDKLIERRVPLQGRQDLIESVDIGFMDPGSGKIEKRTRFSFKVTRAHGYEAGEYKVTIRDGRSGQLIGTPTTLTFEGENEIIDRRAMVFAASDAKKKKKDSGEMQNVAKDDGSEGEASGGGGGEEEGAESEADPSESAETESTEATSAGAAEDPPGEIKEKPGGCGCRVSERQRPHEALGLLGLLALALLRRRAA